MDPALVFRCAHFGYRSHVTNGLPRFTGPAQARQRMRLIAALGMLAIAAITTGGLASLAANRPPRPEREQRPASQASAAELPPLFDPAGRLEAQVQEAERATDQARAMIRSERQRGLVDERLLDALEQRLDALGDAGARTPTQNGTRERVPLDSQPRAL
jgi:hypothetical protein